MKRLLLSVILLGALAATAQAQTVKYCPAYAIYNFGTGNALFLCNEETLVGTTRFCSAAQDYVWLPMGSTCPCSCNATIDCCLPRIALPPSTDTDPCGPTKMRAAVVRNPEPIPNKLGIDEDLTNRVDLKDSSGKWSPRAGYSDSIKGPKKFNPTMKLTVNGNLVWVQLRDVTLNYIDAGTDPTDDGATEIRYCRVGFEIKDPGVNATATPDSVTVLNDYTLSITYAVNPHRPAKTYTVFTNTKLTP